MRERLRPVFPDNDDAPPPLDVLTRLAATAPPAVAPPPPRTRAGRLVERWVPAGLRGARVDPGRPGAVVLCVIAALAAVAAAVGVWLNRPVVEPAPTLSTAVAGPVSGQASVRPTQVVVSVAGRVSHPGLFTLSDGARVADAVQAAGGPLPDTDLSSLNLARKLTDGEQIAVGVPAAVPDAGGPPPRGGGRSHPTGKVDLNAATLDQLRGLPGVGPVTAQRILDWRSAHGRFSSIDQLREVGGIGEAKFNRLKDLVTT